LIVDKIFGREAQELTFAGLKGSLVRVKVLKTCSIVFAPLKVQSLIFSFMSR